MMAWGSALYLELLSVVGGERVAEGQSGSLMFSSTIPCILGGSRHGSSNLEGIIFLDHFQREGFLQSSSPGTSSLIPRRCCGTYADGCKVSPSMSKTSTLACCRSFTIWLRLGCFILVFGLFCSV